jgi:hypothetical protein
MKRFLLIGPDKNLATDGVIFLGIQNLLGSLNLPFQYDYLDLLDSEEQTYPQYLNSSYNALIICGTPWLWDQMWSSHKIQNIQKIFNRFNGQTKRVFLGIGSCFPTENSRKFLRSPEDQTCLRELFKESLVITRDHLAQEVLELAQVPSHFLPCPSFYCYGVNSKISSESRRNVLVWYDPLSGLSKSLWQKRSEAYKTYIDEVHKFIYDHSPLIVCNLFTETHEAKRQKIQVDRVFTGPEDNLFTMYSARRVFSGRVHCAVPALVQQKDITLYPIDSRFWTLADWGGKIAGEADLWVPPPDLTAIAKDYQGLLRSYLSD